MIDFGPLVRDMGRMTNAVFHNEYFVTLFLFIGK